MTMHDRYPFAIEIAKSAGAVLREGFGNHKTVRYKSAIDLVTEYDEQSETLITHAIQERFPQDGILAEESGVIQGTELYGIGRLVAVAEVVAAFDHLPQVAVLAPRRLQVEREVLGPQPEVVQQLFHRLLRRGGDVGDVGSP